MNNDLRKKVKLLKALQGVSYIELSEYLEVSKSSFYNWLAGSYDFGIERQNRLLEILQTISEVDL